jgi:hypothetical protein
MAEAGAHCAKIIIISPEVFDWFAFGARDFSAINERE